MHITARYVIPGFTIMSWLLRKHHSLVRYAPLDSYITLSSSEEWQVTPDRRVRYSSRAKETLNYPLAPGSNEVLMIWNDNRGIKVSSNHFRPPIDNQQTSSSWWLLQKDTKSIQLRLLLKKSDNFLWALKPQKLSASCQNWSRQIAFMGSLIKEGMPKRI